MLRVVANATSTSDFKPQLLRQRTTSLNLVEREADQTEYAPLMRMVLTWLLGDLTAAIPPAEARPTLLPLDEFPLLRAPVIRVRHGNLRRHRVLRNTRRPNARIRWRVASSGKTA